MAVQGRTEVLINPTLGLVVMKVTDAEGNTKAVVGHNETGTEKLIHDLTTSLDALRKEMAKKGKG